jgi:hypothetical protein
MYFIAMLRRAGEVARGLGGMPPRLSNSILFLFTSQIINKLIHMQNAFTVFIVE